MSHRKNLSELEGIIGYSFKNPALLNKALTHRSYLNEAADKKRKSNERMEFLGDAVLQVAISTYIFMNYPDIDEGKMSKIRSTVVCEEGLFDFAGDINLGEYIFMSRGEEMNNGRNKPSILSDAAEAVIAAVYLDSDFETAYSFILSHLKKYIKAAVSNDGNSDFKSRLHEYASSRGDDVQYNVIGESGPEHNKIFTVALIYNGKKTVTAKGHGKKKAEQQAARLMLQTLKAGL